MTSLRLDICSACDSLWRKYAHAATEYLKLEVERQRAIVGKDLRYDDELEPIIAVAAALRTEAREAIRQHEVETHGRSSVPQILPPPHYGKNRKRTGFAEDIG